MARTNNKGITKTGLGSIWYNMRKRCYNERHNSYKNYGARGITVCGEWLNDFEPFYNWALNNNWQEGLDIDRIDNNGNYYPANCRFVTRRENCKNKSNNRILEYNGEEKTLQDWADHLKINQSTLVSRLNRYGWSIEKSLSTPLGKHSRPSKNIDSKQYFRKTYKTKEMKQTTTKEAQTETFEINGIMYIGNLEEAKLDYEMRDEWNYKWSFEDWCKEFLASTIKPYYKAVKCSHDTDAKMGFQPLYLYCKDYSPKEIESIIINHQKLLDSNREMMNILETCQFFVSNTFENNRKDKYAEGLNEKLKEIVNKYREIQ